MSSSQPQPAEVVDQPRPWWIPDDLPRLEGHQLVRLILAAALVGLVAPGGIV